MRSPNAGSYYCLKKTPSFLPLLLPVISLVSCQPKHQQQESGYFKEQPSPAAQAASRLRNRLNRFSHTENRFPDSNNRLRSLSDGHVPHFFRTSNASDKLLLYSGAVEDNVLVLDYLEHALAHLNAQRVERNKIFRLFEFVRNRRFFPNTPINSTISGGSITVTHSVTTAPRNLRRLSWFYLEDGCWFRSEMMTQWANDIIPVGPRTIHKVFLFSKDHTRLNATTKFHPRGYITWWYHTAPLIRSSDDEFYVLDPALDFEKPLLLSEWILRLGGHGHGNIQSLEQLDDIVEGFVITNRFAYKSFSSCSEKISPFDMQWMFAEPLGYMKFRLQVDRLFEEEWDRLEELNLNPEDILGDYPPWVRPIVAKPETKEANQRQF